MFASSPAHAEIWGVKTHDPFSEPPSTLFRFNEDGMSFTAVGEISLEGLPVEVDGLALDADGSLYGFVAGDASGLLISIDPLTAVATGIGMISGREIRGAAFSPAGELVGIDLFANALVQVDPATGTQIGAAVPITLDGELFIVGNGCDLTIAADGGARLSSGAFGIYDVDLATGALTVLLADPIPGEDGAALFGAGLAFPSDPADLRLFVYDVNFDDDIYVYDPADSFARALVYSNIIAGYNAGRGDLASFPRDPESSVDGEGTTPAHPGRLRNFPNPFNPRTTVAFTLRHEGWATVSVYDLSGRPLAVLADRTFTAGEHRLIWNGRTAAGRALPSGSYLVRLEFGSVAVTRKVTLVR